MEREACVPLLLPLLSFVEHRELFKGQQCKFTMLECLILFQPNGGTGDGTGRKYSRASSEPPAVKGEDVQCSSVRRMQYAYLCTSSQQVWSGSRLWPWSLEYLRGTQLCLSLMQSGRPFESSILHILAGARNKLAISERLHFIPVLGRVRT